MDNNLNIVILLKSFFLKLEKRRKIQVIAFFCLIFFSAISETFSIAASLPFLEVITNPQNLVNNIRITKVLSILNLNSNLSDNLILPISIIFALSALLASFMRIFSLWFGTRLSAVIGVDLST